MFESLKETWNKIQQDPPGKRFRRQYRRRQNARETIINRVLFMLIGTFFLILGLVMIFTPGPGIFFFFVGWGLIAQESLLLAVMLDKFEMYLRRWFEWGQETWNRISILSKCVIVFLGVVMSAVVIYWGYLIFLA